MSEDKIWLVSEGSYSDYKILAAFRTEKLAEEHVELMRKHNDYAVVEEYKIWDKQPEYTIEYYREAEINSMGEVTGDKGWDVASCDYDGAPKRKQSSRPTVTHTKTRKQQILLNVSDTAFGWFDMHTAVVRARGHDKAKMDKAFHDRVAQVKAELLGVA